MNRNKGPGADNQAVVNGWENPDNSEKSPVFKDETDVKEEKDEVSFSLQRSYEIYNIVSLFTG